MKTPDKKPLSIAQKRILKRGLESGLTRLEIALYSNPEFTPDQMDEIRLALLQGLDHSEIRVFADPRVSADEMRRIRKIYQDAKAIRQDLKVLGDSLTRTKRRRSVQIEK